MSDFDAIKDLRQDNKSTFSSLYNQYWKKVYNFTQLYSTSAFDAEEVVQEVFIKLWESRHRLEDDSNLSNYLFILTRNTIFSHSRKHFNENNFKMTVLQTLNNSYNPEEELITNDLKEHIFRLIDSLPPRRKEIFELSRKQHLTNREIAKRIGISEKGVERSITLSLNFLRENLKTKPFGLSFHPLYLMYLLQFINPD